MTKEELMKELFAFQKQIEMFNIQFTRDDVIGIIGHITKKIAEL